MEFEWDEAKRKEVYARRGVDLLRAALIFEGPVLTKRDERLDYGEERFISTGMVDGECFVVVHTGRGSVVRLITAWKGGKRERQAFEARKSEAASRNEGTE